MPEGVGRNIPLDPGQVHVLFDHIPGGLGAKRVSPFVYEQVRVFEA